MLIVVKEVNTSFTKTAKGGYSTAVVEYSNENGEPKSWKLISFANPATFDVLKSAKSGETYEIVTGKNDKDFTEWRSATKSEGTTSTIVAAKGSTSSAVRSTYETPEERATRQRLIVRQSSLGHAIEILTTAAKTPPSTLEVKNLAEELVAFVYAAPDLFDETNDVPF